MIPAWLALQPMAEAVASVRISEVMASNWRAINNIDTFDYGIAHRTPSRIGFWSPNRDINLSESFQTDAWEHIAITRAGSTVTIYRNGQPVGSGPWTGRLAPNRIGGRSGGTSWAGFNGMLGDMFMIPHALNAAQVNDLYLGQRFFPLPPAPLHANFSISGAGEEVVLTQPDGTRIDELPPTALPGDVSIGRAEGEGNAWFYLDEATPGAPNLSAPYASILEEAPVFSLPGGFYTNAFDLTIAYADPDPDIMILYTLDGSDPDINHLGGTTYTYKNQYPQEPGDPFGAFLTNTFQSHVYDLPIPILDPQNEPNRLTMIAITAESNPDYFPTEPVYTERSAG